MAALSETLSEMTPFRILKAEAVVEQSSETGIRIIM